MKATSSSARGIASFFGLPALLLLVSPFLRAQNVAQAQDNTSALSTADSGPAPDDSNDPPSRVARISVIDGSVSIQPGGTGDWGNAMKNRPVTIGDKIWVDNGARAELQAGEASLHLGEMTALSFLNLNEGITQIRLAEGKLNFRVREIRQGDVYEVDTPNLAFTVREAGAFRIDVNENGDFTSVTVLRGQGEIAANGQSYPLHANERADVTGTGNSIKYANSAALGPDALDRWALERDSKEENSESAKYVSRDVVGYSDLDDYGTWKDEPDYGHVWVPNNVSPGWSPYSDGYWNWVSPWGWTWVDYSPWGFAPFHYGRWNNFGGYWGWCPGPIYARPFYGPAFVGFVGGFGFGFGLGWGGGYGWFPLGWGEPFHPWYHCGGAYWHNVNVHNTFIHNNVNINNTRNFNYRYAHNASAVTTASHTAFTSGQHIQGANARVSESALRGAHVTNGVNASPSRASYFGASQAHGRVATPSASIQNRSVVARTAPAAAASHQPVHTMGAVTPSSGRYGNSTATGNARGAGATQSMTSTRQAQLSANRPPSASANGASRSGTATRSWSAQGNSTDSGHAPQGFGSSNRANNSVSSARINSQNRPPSSNGSASGSYSGNARTNPNRPPSSMSGSRNYSAPRAYTPPAPRSYSAPHGGYSAPRGGGGGSSAPHSSGGSSGGSHGGGSSHGSGGGGSHGGGGGGHSHR